MATKSIDKKKTLEYAVAFYFYDSGCVNFMMGNIMYQHIKTIYDERADGRGPFPTTINSFLHLVGSQLLVRFVHIR